MHDEAFVCHLSLLPILKKFDVEVTCRRWEFLVDGAERVALGIALFSHFGLFLLTALA